MRANIKLFDALYEENLSDLERIKKIAEALINGADVNDQDKGKIGNGNTPLHIAIEKNYSDMVVRCLLEKGAKSNIRNNNQKTALDLAKDLEKQDITEILKNYNQKVETIIDSGQQETSSKRKSTDNDEDGTDKKMRFATVKRRHYNENPNDNEDGVSPEKSRKVISDKPNVDEMPGKDKSPNPNDNDIVSTANKGWLDKSKIPSEGSKLAQHGNIFQLKLLMLFLWRAKEADYFAFRLATELSEAEKFDDVVLQYQQKNGKKWKFRLLQAKHKEGATVEAELPKIKKADLLSTDNNEPFSLQKYFRAYLKIKQRSKENSIYSVFSESEIEDIIVITNTNFDSELQNHFTCNKEDIEKDELLKVHKDSNTKRPEALVCKLEEPENNAIVRQLKPIFENTSDFYKLVEELADHILTGKQIDKTGLFKDYYYPLINKVFTIEEEEGRNELPSDNSQLKELAKKLAKKQRKNRKSEYYPLSKFISEDNLSEEAEKFREALIKEITFIQNDQELITISEEFGKNELPSDDSQLKELAKKLANCVEQNQQLTVSNFRNYHIALAKKIINPNTNKFFTRIEKDSNEWKFIEFFKTEFAIIRKEKKITPYQLKLIKFLVSQDFGESKLPNDDSKLEKLAKTLADTIKGKEKLQPSLSEEFKNYHVALATEVIDINTKKFQNIFIHGKVKEGNNIKQLSTLPKQFRRILLNKMVNDEQVQNTKDSLKLKNIKFSEGFEKAFIPEKNPIIAEVQEFVQQIKELLSKSGNEKIVKINENSVTLNTFEANIKKLAGYVLIEKFNKVRFSTSFLRSDELPDNLKNFRDELKSSLGQEKFELIYEYEFDIKVKGFKTCEEGALDRKLPVLHEAAHVTHFCQKLKFVVNYPNRLGVNDLLEGEIQNKLKKLDSKAFNALYQEDLHNWLADRVGTLYTVDKAATLFNEINNNLLLWIMDGVNKPYFADGFIEYKFNEYDALTKFLQNKQQVLSLVFQDLQLGRIRIVQTFQDLQEREYNNIQQYTRGFGHIFLYLKQLLNNDFRTEVLKYFQDSKHLNLIVIECDTQQEIQGLDDKSSFYDMLSEVFLQSSSNTNSNKKIILITKQNDALANKFATDPQYKSEKDTSSFKDLSQLSQDNLLEKPIVLFQGEKISLNKLIDKEDKKTKQIIDLETLMKLIKGDEVTIGELKGLGEINDYYIIRRFNQQVTFNKAKIKEGIERSRISDFFVIRGTDSGLTSNNKIYVFDNNNYELADSKFQELCKQNTVSNIHWLKSESGKLIWHKSQGSVSNLVKYREIDKVDRTDDKTSNLELDPEKKYLEENKSKIVIISDPAGMGKSTVLTSLSMKIKKANPSLWVIRIDLNDYTTVFVQELEKRKSNKQSFSNQDVNKVVNFLLKSQKSLNLTTNLEQELFKSSVNGQGKIALLFDGFDEISPDYQDVVIDILQALKNSKVEKLFVTTRPNMRELLEEKLAVFSHVLEPFGYQNQIEFFSMFWTKKLELNQECKERLNVYAESVIGKFSTSINDREQTFIGIPLQTMMLAEVFQENQEGTLKEWEGCKEFLTPDNTHKNPKLPEEFDLLGLYKQFVNRKFYEFHLRGKKGRDFSKTGEKKSAEIDYENFKKMHESLALSELFSDDDLTKLLQQSEIEQLKNWIKDINNVKSNEGIIDKIIDNKPRFIHRTFAEYFASLYIVKKMSSDYKTICRAVESLVANTSPVFIAKKLNKEKVRVEGYTVLDFITRNKKIYLKFFNALLEIYYKDHLGKTSLHYAVEHNYGDTIEYVLNYKHDILEKDILKHGSFKKPEYENSNWVKFVNQKDNQGKTALNYADNFKLHMMLSFKLLLNGANIDGLTQEYLKKLIDYMLTGAAIHNVRNTYKIFNCHILGAFANQDNKFRPIQEKLLLQAPDAVSHLTAHYQYPRLLSYFFVHGRVKVIDTLLRSINDKEKQKRILNAKDNDHAPLDRVNYSDQLSDYERLEITKYLLENGSTKATYEVGYCNKNKSYITKILQAAAKRGHIKTFQYFIGQENPDYYNLHFSYACANQQFNISEYLLKNHRKNMTNNGGTALHRAVASGASLKIIKFVIDNGENVNTRNDEGDTPLFMAIYAHRRLNIIKYLVDHGADVNIADNLGYTVLYYAIKNDQRDTINYLLLKRNAEIKLTSELLRNKVLFFKNPKEFNLNLADKNGMPRLHRAIQSEDLEWAEFIMRNGGNVNIEDQEGKTPLHVASQFLKHDSRQLGFVKLLFQYGAMYDKAHKKPIALFHNTEVSLILNTLDELFGSQDLLESLYSKHIHNCTQWQSDNHIKFLLNARNHEGKSLLHIAANTNSFRALYTLLNFNDYLRIVKSGQIPSYKDYQYISIDAIDSQKNTPLHLAAQKGHTQMVSLLLKEGAIFEAENFQGKTPEELAELNDHYNITELLQTTKNLFIAIKENNLEEVKSYINKGAYINAKDKNGKTPLHFASSSDQSDIVQFLLKKGANIDAIDVCNRTPLHFATENNEIEIVKLLLKNGAIFDEKDIHDKAPFDLEENQSVNLLNKINELFDNVQSDNPQVSIDNLEMVHKDYKVDISTIINTRDNERNTLLHHAAKSYEFNIVKFLLENGAIFDAKNELKETAKNVTNSQDIYNLLKSIKNMFDNVDNIYQEQDTVTVQIIINVRNDLGKTLLHKAALSNKLDTVKLLVDYGAEVNAKDTAGNTALDIAMKEDYQPLVMLLKHAEDRLK